MANDKVLSNLDALRVHIAENGCRPRAVKRPRRPEDRVEDRLQWWARGKAKDPAFRPLLEEAGYFDAPTYAEKAAADAWLESFRELCASRTRCSYSPTTPSAAGRAQWRRAPWPSRSSCRGA